MAITARLRELNDLNCARFSADVHVRFVEQDARIERRFAEFEIKFTNQLNELRAELRAELHTAIAKVESRLAWQMTTMFITMAGVMVSIGMQVLYH